MSSDDEMDAIEQAAGEELAMWMGVGDDITKQRNAIQTNKEINQAMTGNRATLDTRQQTVQSDQLAS